VRREADRVIALPETDAATRDTIARTMFRLDAARAEIVRLEHTLSDEAAARASSRSSREGGVSSNFSPALSSATTP